MSDLASHLFLFNFLLSTPELWRDVKKDLPVVTREVGEIGPPIRSTLPPARDACALCWFGASVTDSMKSNPPARLCWPCCHDYMIRVGVYSVFVLLRHGVSSEK